MSIATTLPAANCGSRPGAASSSAVTQGVKRLRPARANGLKRLLFQAVAALLLVGAWAVLGAPFAKQFHFTQPDGTRITLWGQGDEFYAVFETLDGYTVRFNQQIQAYEYAQLSTDGDQLLSTGVVVGQGDPVALGFKQHVRINPEAVQRQAAERFARWDEAMEITRRWTALKAGRRMADQAAAMDGPLRAPPPFTTTGAKLGLTLLVDFSDDLATIPQAEIFKFCNSDNYTGDGNNGSVKKFYLDNSNNLLTYSNVVTIYIRAPQPKTYYNDTAIDCGTEGRLLLKAALAVLKALPNYTTDILPLFSGLTVDGSSRVVACNVFFAGGDSGVWSYGLWPHSSALSNPVPLGNGKSVYRYQITNIGTSLELGTFCHENGHMLCGYPDIYDYDYDSKGGAGNFCLMNSGSFGGNPAQICAYLKRASGWATAIELNSHSNFTATVSSSGTGFNEFYRYSKPGVPTEYFLVENRQSTGRDANLPSSGIAVWHIDELGDNNDQRTDFNTSHLNYEVSLMQADNLLHLQNNVNSGDFQDLYYLGNAAVGYGNRFSDATRPGARWWDGSASGIIFHHFSASGRTMTFGGGPESPIITFDPITLAVEGCPPANGVIDAGEAVAFNLGLTNSGRRTANLVVTLLPSNGVASPSSPQNYGALIAGGAAVARPFTFTANRACGGVCTTVFQLQEGSTNYGNITNAFRIGVGGALASSNYSSGGVAVAIPDSTPSGVEVPISIPNAGIVTDVNVRVRLNHTYDSDLVLALVHPDGTAVTLANKRGGAGDNFGSGASDCSGIFTVFDDAAGTPINSGAAPFAGSYRPTQPLSNLNGKAVMGTWKLRVADTGGGDTGTIYCFQLDFTRQEYTCCNGGNAAPTLTGIEGTTLDYITNQAATAITATLTANDDGSLTNATVSITSGFVDGEDVLVMSPNPQNGIAAAESGNGLTLTGTANAASYQDALHSVSYVNNASHPTLGTRTVAFAVTDGGGLASAQQSRNLAVIAVNVSPMANAVFEETNEDTAKTIHLSGSDVETCELAFSILSNPSQGSLSGPTNNFPCAADAPNQDTDSLIYTPAPNYNGPDSFTYQINDGTLVSAPATVTLTVNPVNDSPSFAKGPDQNVVAGSAPQSVKRWVRNISPGPGDESPQVVDFIVTNNHNALFSVPPTVSPSGTLRFTPAANTTGVAIVSVQLHDDGGTVSGGMDTSAAQVFTITLAAAQPPVLSVSLSDGLVLLTWISHPGRTNSLEYTGDLPATNWIALTNLLGTGSPMGFADGPISINDQRFYRVRVQ